MCLKEEVETRMKVNGWVLYSTGLRRGELQNLKPKDIDSDRMLICVQQGKGKKDHNTLLSKSVLHDLRKYYKKDRSKEYLFEGQYGGPYSSTSIRNIVIQATSRAQIKRKVTPHMLRHSFATHLLEEGVDLRYIQTLLGYNSSLTTEVYPHVAVNALKNIKDLLD